MKILKLVTQKTQRAQVDVRAAVGIMTTIRRKKVLQRSTRRRRSKRSVRRFSPERLTVKPTLPSSTAVCFLDRFRMLHVLRRQNRCLRRRVTRGLQDKSQRNSLNYCKLSTPKRNNQNRQRKLQFQRQRERIMSPVTRWEPNQNWNWSRSGVEH